MKSFNNWIFIELKRIPATTTICYYYICLADASKRPVKHSKSIWFGNRFNLFCQRKTFPLSDAGFRYVFPHRRRRHTRIDGRYAEWVSFVAENEITLSHAERLPFALIAIHFVLGKMKETRKNAEKRRCRATEAKSNLMGILHISVAIYEKGMNLPLGRRRQHT